MPKPGPPAWSRAGPEGGGSAPGLPLDLADLVQLALMDDHGHLIARVEDPGGGGPPEAIQVADFPCKPEGLLDFLAMLVPHLDPDSPGRGVHMDDLSPHGPAGLVEV